MLNLHTTIQQARVFLSSQTLTTANIIQKIGRTDNKKAAYTFSKNTDVRRHPVKAHKDPRTIDESAKKKTPSQPAQASPATDGKVHDSKATQTTQDIPVLEDIEIGHRTIGRSIIAYIEELKEKEAKTKEAGKEALKKHELDMLAMSRELNHYKKENKSLSDKITDQGNQMKRLNQRISDMNQSMGKLQNRLGHIETDRESGKVKLGDIAKISKLKDKKG